MRDSRLMAMMFGVSCGLMLMLVSGCTEQPETLDVLISDMEPVAPETVAYDTAASEKTEPNAVKLETAELERPVAAEVGPWPQAKAKEMEFDFGRMSIGTELEHSFEITNEGDADLVLQPGKPTCKCTAFEVTPETVKPGGAAVLTVRWVGKFKDTAFQHGGPVYTNDPKNPTMRFAVKGMVDANLDLIPEETWRVGEMIDGEPGEVEGVLLSRVHKEFSITDIKCDSPFLKAETVPLTEKDLAEQGALSGYKIKVIIAPEMPLGLLEEKMSFSVDCDKSPVTFNVTASRHGPIRILPLPGVVWSETTDSLRLGQFSSRQGREAALMLLVQESEGAEPLKFTEVESSPSYLSLELERIGTVGKSKARYKMTIRIPPGVQQTKRTAQNPGIIDIKTNHPVAQALRLRILYQARF